VTPTYQSSPPTRGSAVDCALAGDGQVQATAEGLAAVRPKLGPPGGEPLAASVLKHFDEQTLAALAACYRAIGDHGLAGMSFADWGVVAVPRFLGRGALAHTLERFALEGAWGISPHLIPHHTLHAVSGALSLALQAHGPNFGIDGSPDGVSQGLLAAAGLLAEGRLPGVWLVLTGWRPEPVPQKRGEPPRHVPAEAAPVCQALALALTPAGSSARGRRLTVVPGAARHQAAVNGHAAPLLGLEALAAAFGPDRRTRPVTWRTTCGGRVTLAPARGGEDEP
jgi:hypothetical protein